jgi:uncharacterized protein
VILNVYVQPGAKKNEIIGLHDGALKVKIQAPPEDGRANEALIDFFSEILEIPARQISLVSGHKSRNKKLAVEAPSETLKTFADTWKIPL